MDKLSYFPAKKADDTDIDTFLKDFLQKRKPKSTDGYSDNRIIVHFII